MLFLTSVVIDEHPPGGLPTAWGCWPELKTCSLAVELISVEDSNYNLTVVSAVERQWLG